ncbi:MAG: GGDEF domain-containing protein [Candidatus Faecousia sp.]|nr:GGDEF domain-containing protein [Candidatus Faecousia sp.]
MKHPSKLNTRAILLFGITSGLFLLFFFYIGFFEGASVYQARPFLGCRQVTEYAAEQYASDSSPTGYAKEFTWTLEEVSAGGECLNIYLVHHTAQVYLDDELVYDLSSGAGSRICGSVGSNWCSIPLYPEDSGKTVSVVTEPAFSVSAGRNPEFYQGSRYEVFRSFLTRDLLELLLSSVCILLGLFITAISLYLRLARKAYPTDMVFLGIFSLLIGVWRVTDMRTTTFFFSGSTVLLSYITIGVLCLCVIPLLLMISVRFGGAFSASALWLAVTASCAALVILACQIFGIAEFRETLILCHILILLTLAAALGSAVINFFQNRGSHQMQSLWYVGVLGTGVLLDLVRFYSRGNSAGMDFTLGAFIVFTLIQFTHSVIETSTLAYTDSQTGLFNKQRWDTLMAHDGAPGSCVGIMMLDLNRLKYTNDTLGHEAGDQMIFNFSNILRNILPPDSVICRWGGDEFTVLITDATRERMEQSIQDLHAAADGYNRFGRGPAIYFAAGFALSSDYPNLSRAELLSKADEAMYRDKRTWYAQHPLA